MTIVTIVTVVDEYYIFILIRIKKFPQRNVIIQKVRAWSQS